MLALRCSGTGMIADAMKISAVIPAYNSATFLPQAITSVLAQSESISEIIVVDDGSTDDTRGVLEQFGSAVQYVHQENQGPSAARNRGIDLAEGDWIAFLDADDQWTEDKTQEQIEIVRRHPEVALVASDMAEVDPSGNVLVPSVLNKHHLLDWLKSLNGAPIPHAMAALVQKNFIPTGAVLVNKAVLDQVGRFDEQLHFGEDLELWVRVSMRHAIVCVPKVHLLRTRHGSNLVNANTEMFQDLVEVMQRIRHYGTDTLKAQGVNMDAQVAQAWSNLGYWLFSEHESVLARSAFRASLKEYPSFRALIYYPSCLLPPSLLYKLRGWKQHWHKSTETKDV